MQTNTIEWHEVQGILYIIRVNAKTIHTGSSHTEAMECLQAAFKTIKALDQTYTIQNYINWKVA